MNILFLNGSPRVNGNTKKILEVIRDNIVSLQKVESVNIVEINLAECHIEYCKGCEACFAGAEDICPIKDDVSDIKNKMKEADAIILGSPVYVEDVSGLTKNWIDRMAYNCHRPFLLGKPVYLFTVSGAKASKHAFTTMKHAFTGWGAVVQGGDNYSTGHFIKKDQATQLYGKQIEMRIKTLLYNTAEKKVSLYSLIAFQVQKKYWISKKDSNFKYDYQYWKEQGWLNQDSNYYKNTQIHWFKKFLSGLISKFVQKILF